MHGFYGRILLVNLTARRYRIEPVADEIQAACLGGKGLATRLLLDRNPPGVDPFAPENHLIFATGPICRSRIWGSSRYGVFTKSPQTGLYSESYAGGKAPEAVDAAGFDAVLFYGRASQPLVVSVHPGGLSFSMPPTCGGPTLMKPKWRSRSVSRFNGKVSANRGRS